MATISAAAQSRHAGVPAQTTTGGSDVTEPTEDHGLARFFYAAGAALILSAIQGVIQRMPGISDWLLDGDHGGHMVTNLAHTHITIVGAGTISLTALIYYVLPKVTKVPLYSKALTNLSFWATLIGVFGFYLSMLAIGTYESAMVHAGWPYRDAANWMGAWHKAPMAVTAAIMGIGYWTFVTNVYMTVGRGAGLRKIAPEKGASDSEFLLAKFFAVGATGLLFGTIQGVYQVLPWSLDWLHATGSAGELIDPMAHAHMNLVAGVSVALMGALYFFLPRMTGRPIFSMTLAKFSFWCTFIGVFAFYFSALGLGWAEGNMMLEQHISDVDAKAAIGTLHPVLLASAASIMGIGFWCFITNILLTLRRKPSEDAPADRRLALFIGFSTIALLCGTIQGVIQILQPVAEWLDDARGSGYLVTPLAHAQLNMVGFVMISLLTMSVFLLPRIMGRPVVDPVGGRRALTVLAVGIASTYVAFLGVGLVESIAIHNGVDFVAARSMVGGPWGRYILFVGAQLIVGTGYILMFRHFARIIGRETIRAYFRTFRGRMSIAGHQAVRVHPRALPLSWGEAHRRALTAFAAEALGGGLGFMGLGWFLSGRPFIGIMVLGTWGGGFWTFAYVVLASGGMQLFTTLLLPYFLLPVLSAIGCYRSYLRDARLHLAGEAWS